MAADPGITSLTFWITYPDGEKPIGFIVHNKGLWSISVAPEYFAIPAGFGVQFTTSFGINSNPGNLTGYQAQFTATATDNVASLSNIEIAPIFPSMITE